MNNQPGSQDHNSFFADIVIYGANSGGITAAIQARRSGKSVILLEPTRWIGGLTASGLGETDFGRHDNPVHSSRGRTVGGLAREFYQRVRYYYDHQNSLEFPGVEPDVNTNTDIQRSFEPSVATAVYERMLAENRVGPPSTPA